MSSEIKTISYTLRGLGDITDDAGVAYMSSEPNSPQVHAKKVIGQNNTYYYVKTNKRTHFLFNPLDEVLTLCEFKQVKHNVFLHYVTFLKTRNMSYLRYAESELANA